MLNDYKSLSEEDLDKKIADVQKKMNLAFKMGHAQHVPMFFEYLISMLSSCAEFKWVFDKNHPFLWFGELE